MSTKSTQADYERVKLNVDSAHDSGSFTVLYFDFDYVEKLMHRLRQRTKTLIYK